MMSEPGPETNATQNGAPGLLSVVVPVHNGAATLARCLVALARSERRPCEVLVADDASTDASAQIARAHGARVIPGGVSRGGPAAARNRAAARATGDVLAFVDADVEVAADTLGRLLAALDTDPGVAAAFGSYDDTPAVDTAVSRYANLRHHHVHQHGDPEARTFWAGCGVVRRADFERVGGFSRHYGRPSIEDIELGLRLRAAGRRIRLVAAAQATHLKRWTLRGLWRTDVKDRALPWAHLMVAGGAGASALNGRPSERVAAAAAHLLWIGVFAGAGVGPAALGVSVAAAAALAWMNRGFAALLWRRGGARGLAVGSALHVAYYLYASGVYAAVRLASAWRVPADRRTGSWQWARAGWLLGVALLLLGAATAWALAWVDTGGLLEALRRREHEPARPRFDHAALAAAQGRFLIAGVGYALAAGGLAAVGPRPAARALQRGVRRVRRGAGSTTAVLGLLTLAAMLAALPHLGQPLRTDEAVSYLNYGTRSFVFALCSYDTSNNHVAASLLMRASVWLLGDGLWAIRLPALLCSVLAVPALYAAGRRFAGHPTALLASALLASSFYLTDVGTNARGYPLLNLMFLVVLALVPAAAAGRAAACGAAAVAGAVGLWAAPVMLYPLAAAGVFLLLRGAGSSGARLRRALLTAGATAGIALLLYAPALAVTDPGRAGAVATLDAEVQRDGVAERARILGWNLRVAWRLWVTPWGVWGGGLALLLAAIGVVRALVRSGRARTLVVAAVLGPLAVTAATAVAPLPWWSMTWGFPLAVLAVAGGLTGLWTLAGAAVRGHLPRGAGFAAGAAAAAVVFAGSKAGLSPAAMPHYVGLRDVDAVLKNLSRLETGTRVWVTTPDPILYAPLVDALGRRGLPAGRILRPASDLRVFEVGDVWLRVAQRPPGGRVETVPPAAVRTGQTDHPHTTVTRYRIGG